LKTQIIIFSGRLALYTVFRQEAQLSQRDRATLGVIEYFAKSLNIIESHVK